MQSSQMVVIDLYKDVVPLPRAARFPVELHPPEGFEPSDPASWPTVEGCLEFVDGRLLYMPPSGDIQQYVTGSLAAVLVRWRRDHPAFLVGTNEAGMILGGDVRAADAAVWEHEKVGAPTGGYARVPPVLAVEVAGVEQDEEQLRERARWYLERGVVVVWLVFPRDREVLVLTAQGETRVPSDEPISEHPALPGLSPRVVELFEQLP